MHGKWLEYVTMDGGRLTIPAIVHRHFSRYIPWLTGTFRYKLLRGSWPSLFHLRLFYGTIEEANILSTILYM